MQITRAAEYAIRGVLYLSLQAEGSVCLLGEISERQQIPPSFLSKIFQNLARAGIVSSSRGTGGGFMLIKDPRDISLLDVVEAIEGPISLNMCLGNGQMCEQRPTCAVHSVWRDAQNHLLDLLKKKSFFDLAETSRRLCEEVAREPQPSD
ncbi:MAG: Rrf2 family transcriptional regulator [Candidatus Abyssobacteria bacterium SURF_5]|uniref:Rrf2 family transcriptional regulator n=1 Tax=Abyssobacteria bacterium (strain SURF_5) TaxID=2093360 RepID=A0A3A4NGG8_ABYX5|nr:MAG: Rrf2 family transcriptional regulator [Candidatus Abyssubacteria bacterium SURF_5]